MSKLKELLIVIGVSIHLLHLFDEFLVAMEYLPLNQSQEKKRRKKGSFL